MKDKTYTSVDVSHACEKALAAGVRKVVFAVGHEAEKTRVSQSALIEYWAEKGLELSFLTIADSLGVALAVCDEGGRRELATNIYESLVEINAPDEVRNLFQKTFQGTAARVRSRVWGTAVPGFLRGGEDGSGRSAKQARL